MDSRYSHRAEPEAQTEGTEQTLEISNKATELHPRGSCVPGRGAITRSCVSGRGIARSCVGDPGVGRAPGLIDATEIDSVASVGVLRASCASSFGVSTTRP